MRIRPILLTIFLATLFFGLTTKPADAARFYFTPASGSIGSNCDVQTVNVMLDTEGADTNAADIEITFNSANIVIVDQDLGSPGTQVNTGGSSYQLFVGNSVTGNKILLTGFMDTGVFNGDGIFAQITFTPNLNAGAATFNIRFDGVGASLDSNVSDAVTNSDLLTSVTNASYSMSLDCPPPVIPPPPPPPPPVIPPPPVTPPITPVDTTGPAVTLLTPPPGNSNVDINSNIQVQIIDSSGVDLSTVVIVIDGVEYTTDSPELSYEVTPGGYIFTINPIDPFEYDQLINITATAEDSLGNETTTNFSFKTSDPPIVDSDPPVIDLVSPNPETPGIPSDSEFIIHLTDPGTGIDLETLIITYQGKEYTIHSPEVTFEGNLHEYVITFTPGGNGSIDPFTLKVKVSDFDGNENIKTFTFNLNQLGPLASLINFLSRPSSATALLLLMLLLSYTLWFGIPGLLALPWIIAGRILIVSVETLDINRDRIKFVQVIMKNDKRNYQELTNLSGFARFFVRKEEYLLSAIKSNFVTLETKVHIEHRNIMFKLFMNAGINTLNTGSIDKLFAISGQIFHILAPVLFTLGLVLAIAFIAISQELIALCVLASYLITFALWVSTRRKEIIEIR